MDAKQYWRVKHEKYSSKDWIDKPSLFAQFVVQYFPKNGRLLDLGAGQGQDSRYFARLGYKVESTDFSEKALDIARQKARDENLDMEFANLDLSEDWPYENEVWDIVYSHLALHYFDERTTEKIFTQIHRVLKAGGELAALLNTMDDPEVNELEKIGEGLYRTPTGLVKRFFTVEYLKEKIAGKFDPIVLDTKGRTYKDEITTLVRFVGKKI